VIQERVMAARRADDKRNVRRVVAAIPSGLYIRLYTIKLWKHTTLERLLEEGVTLVVSKYRLEREAQREGDANHSEGEQ
jgi:hypothetical protein